MFYCLLVLLCFLPKMVQPAPQYNIKVQGKVEFGEELADMIKAFVGNGGVIDGGGNGGGGGYNVEIPHKKVYPFIANKDPKKLQKKPEITKLHIITTGHINIPANHHKVPMDQQHIYGQHIGK